VGTLSTMPVTSRDHLLHGPGVYDMKAGLVQLVFALDALIAAGIEPSVTPVILINTDEETGSLESTRWVSRLAQLADRVFVLEPSLGVEGLLKTARKGVARYTITISGIAAHAGLDPESGASAILELSLVIQQLFDLNDPAHGISVNVGTIDGGLRPNVVAPRSHAVVDVRVERPGDAERIEEAIQAITPSTPGTSILVSGGITRPPMERTPRNQRLWLLAHQAATELGISLGEGRAGGSSDGNTASRHAPTLDGLGAVGDGAHAAHEHVDVGRMVERSALLARLLSARPLAALPDPGDWT
jgi:glutamate carboxypeptidase